MTTVRFAIMFSCLPCSTSKKNALKPFKVRTLDDKRKIGIAAESVAQLRLKSREKFKLEPGKSLTLVLEADGTEVEDDEYLETLQPHVSLVILKNGERWEGVPSQLETALQNILTASNLPQTAREIESLIRSEKNPAYLDLLGKIASTVAMNIEANLREDDPDWFSDVPGRFKTKHSFMREKARQRVRGYLSHTKDFIKKQKLNPRTRKKLTDICESFMTSLKKEDYFSAYFDRSSSRDGLRMCDSDGWFQCEGSFDQSKCDYNHFINPYGNLHYRRLLSTWDLDHTVEKSRTVLPCLKKAASNPVKVVNYDYFFALLFTRRNLKLVNPVCHDKSGHSTARCDPKLEYID